MKTIKIREAKGGFIVEVWDDSQDGDIELTVTTSLSKAFKLARDFMSGASATDDEN